MPTWRLGRCGCSSGGRLDIVVDEVVGGRGYRCHLMMRWLLFDEMVGMLDGSGGGDIATVASDWLIKMYILGRECIY
jgi:hypothetical protein